MTTTPRRLILAFSGLGFRMMVMFGVVLMPLAILSYVQIRQYQREAAARAEAAVLGRTMQAAAPLVDAITRSQGAAAGLAIALPAVLDDPVACRRLMDDFLALPGNEIYSFGGFIDRDLKLRCSSAGEHDLSDMKKDLLPVFEAGRPALRINPQGIFSQSGVQILSHPVRDAGGRLLGMVSLSMLHTALPVRSGSGAETPLALITLNDQETVLNSSIRPDSTSEFLPADVPLAQLAEGPARSFTGQAMDGQTRVFAVVPLASDNLYLLGVWPPTVTDTTIIDTQIPILAFPALMWLASLLVALLAAEHQVLRHIRTLRNSITRFAAGDRRMPELDLDHAPLELRKVGDAFEQMMESVVHDEAELEDMVHQKEVLLREVHHRVKNNLQLIASIINLQIRKAQSPESKSLLKGLQDRVMSLATIHRELYQTTGLTDIRADELLQSIVSQITRMANRPGDPIRISTRLDDIRLTPDQAVPLSLLVTEALTNALKYCGAPPGRKPTLRVEL
ncbi:MAG: histidine kinase, partial [Gemmobacter sp.]|nr:histidine kinase [Gemmobacter sp.]